MNNIVTNLIIHYGVGYVADVASTFLRRAEYRPFRIRSKGGAEYSVLSWGLVKLNFELSNWAWENEFIFYPKGMEAPVLEGSDSIASWYVHRQNEICTSK